MSLSSGINRVRMKGNINQSNGTLICKALALSFLSPSIKIKPLLTVQ